MSQVLKAIRDGIRQSGQTRYAISKSTGIDQAQLSRLMRSQSGLSLDTLEKLCQFLDLEIVIRPKRGKRQANGKHHA